MCSPWGSGLVLGVALGLVSVPMPGGGSFALGPAAGPLLVGMVLGALRRTGPVVWALPGSANITLRQLGLLLFLAGLGLTAGPDVASVLSSPTAWRAAVLSVVVAALSCVALLLAGRWVLDLSAPRVAGAMAGFLGQPAVLDAANSKPGRRAHRNRLRHPLRLLHRGENRAGPGHLEPLSVGGPDDRLALL